MSFAGQWNCPNCDHPVATPFCPTCGEQPLAARDLTLRGLLHQSVLAFSSVDGRLLRSFRSLMTRPGALTIAYAQGRQKPFLGPFQLFFVANVLFFGMQSLTGSKIFSTPLDAHLHTQIWSGLAQRLVADHVAATQRTIETYAPLFDRAVVLNAKSLVILMVLPFSLLLPILFHRSGIPFAVQVVFSLHFHAFLLLLFCAALVVTGVDLLIGGAGLGSDRLDHGLSLILVAASVAYLYVAAGTVYGAKGVVRVLEVAALALAAIGIVLGYRFALFLITLYRT